MGISNLHFGLGCLVDPASYLGSKILPGVAVFTTDTVSAKKYPFAGMAVAPKLRGEVGYHIILIHHPKSVGELLIEGFFKSLVPHSGCSVGVKPRHGNLVSNEHGG